jgi:hypothetical protein
MRVVRRNEPMRDGQHGLHRPGLRHLQWWVGLQSHRLPGSAGGMPQLQVKRRLRFRRAVWPSFLRWVRRLLRERHVVVQHH